MRVLYLTYNGLTEPLGRRQVLPYLVGLSRLGWRFEIVSFEKPQTADDEARRQVSEELGRAGAVWRPRRYHKHPTVPATAFDVAMGIVASARRRGRVDLVHARSTVPAVMASLAARILGVPWIFDVRGLLAEEYADAGHWPRDGALFRVARGWEARLLRRASGVVVLTERIREELSSQGLLGDKPVAVIPCAVDLAAFTVPDALRARSRAALDLPGGPVLVYSGSLGSWYRLGEMLDFFTHASAEVPDLSLLVLTPSEDQARALVAGHPLAARIRVRRVRPEDVPASLAAADAGLCFLGDHHSKAASSPTKYGEYLAAGLAVVTNPWTGDAARLEGEEAWTLVKAFSPEAYREAAARLRHQLADRVRLREAARALAERCFSLEDAVESYDRLYRRVLEGRR